MILAGDKDEDDDDAEAYLVEEAPKDDLAGGMDSLPQSTAVAEADVLNSSGGEHGALVQEILETQKQLENEDKSKRGGVKIVS